MGELLRTQLFLGASIFGCEEYRVYSDVDQWLSPGKVNTIKVDDVEGNFHFAKRKRVGKWVNSNMFIQAWRKIKDEGVWSKWDFTVKVDVDAVFLPSRLRKYLEKFEVTDNGIYLETCKYVNFGFFGSCAVISHNAAATYMASTRSLATTSTLMPLAQHGAQRARRRTGNGSPTAPSPTPQQCTTSRHQNCTSTASRPLNVKLDEVNSCAD